MSLAEEIKPFSGKRNSIEIGRQPCMYAFTSISFLIENIGTEQRAINFYAVNLNWIRDSVLE